MQAIVKYSAKDGSEWSSEKQAADRELMIDEVLVAMSNLKNHPTELNWEGYVQQEFEAIRNCKTALFEIANAEGVLKWWIDGQKRKHGKSDTDLIEAMHPSWFGRMLDGGFAPLSKAYGRLCCIDEQGREWNQPYFANNPDKGEQTCVD